VTKLVEEDILNTVLTYPWCIVGAGTGTVCEIIAFRRIGIVNKLRGPSGRLLNVSQASRRGLELLSTKVGFFSSGMDVAVNCAFEVRSFVVVESIVIVLIVEVGEH